MRKILNSLSVLFLTSILSIGIYSGVSGQSISEIITAARGGLGINAAASTGIVQMASGVTTISNTLTSTPTAPGYLTSGNMSAGRVTVTSATCPSTAGIDLPTTLTLGICTNSVLVGAFGNGLQIFNAGTGPTGGDKGAGTINAAGVYYANGTAGVSCSGTPSASFASVNGVVTHC